MNALVASSRCSSRCCSSSSSAPSAVARVAAPVAARRQHARAARSQSGVCRAVNFSEDFKSILAAALERQSDEVVDRIGIPGMVIDQKLDDVSLLAWEAGIQLAVWLRDHVDLRGKRVLELGSGTGLVGVTCGALGAHVTCTDLPAVLNSTQSIIGKNLATVADAGGSINVRALDWYTPNDDILNGPWDMIIGSDLVYCSESPRPLAALVRELLLRNPGAAALIAHRHRNPELDDNMEREFAAQGMSVTDLYRTCSTKAEADISIDDIRLM